MEIAEHTIENARTAGIFLLLALAVAAAAAGAASFVRSAQGDSAGGSSPVSSQALEVPELTARAAILYDPLTKEVLFEKNAEAQLPLASLTKLMTAAAVLANASTRDIVEISSADLAPLGDSGLRPGETWSVGDLLKLGLVASSNDAMAAVANSVGAPTIIARMNEEAQRLGLVQTYFLDPTGLDLTGETAGAYGSARDIALLTADFLKNYPEVFEQTTKGRIEFSDGGRSIEATSTSIPIHDIPGLIGAKTGYTELAGGNLVAAVDIEMGHPVIAVVLHSTESGRFEDIRALINAVRRDAIGDTQ